MDSKSKSVKQSKKETLNLIETEGVLNLKDNKILSTSERRSLETLLLKFNLSSEEFINRYPNHPKVSLLKQL